MNPLTVEDILNNPQNKHITEERDAYAKTVLAQARAASEKMAVPYKPEYKYAIASTGIGAALTAVAFKAKSKTARIVSGIGAALSGIYAAFEVYSNHGLPRINRLNKSDADEMIHAINAIEQSPELYAAFVNHLAQKEFAENGDKKTDMGHLATVIYFAMACQLVSKENSLADSVLFINEASEHPSKLMRSISNVSSKALTER